MPSRRSNASSDAALSSDSRRTSLRRLSSIASLQNLFSRRRSHHAADQHTIVSSGSDLSASTSSVDTTLRTVAGSASTANLLQHGQEISSELPAEPPPSHTSNRTSRYICLPDDPIGGMPRSRTFSNLPVPSRAKKVPVLNVGSNSHTRLPSTLLPSTRLPSPPASTRKHSHSRLMSADARPPVRTRLERSDTEPLLGLEAAYPPTNLPRSTTFKENISLSPVRPLPTMNMEYQNKQHYSSSPLYSGQYQPPGAWVSSSSDVGDTLSSSVPSTAPYSPPPPPPISKYASHPAIQMVRDYKSTPVRPLYRSSRDRPPTPGASSLNPVVEKASPQRWNSQPILTARQNNHEHPARKDSKQHKEIRQTRLMSARQAPTPPPPPKTPMGNPTTATGSKVKGANNSASAGDLPQTSEQTPTQPKPDPPTAAAQVTTPEPPAYWAGRLSALADRYRNEELASLLQPSARAGKVDSTTTATTTLTPKAQTDKLHTPEASYARLKRAFEELSSRCATREARESLLAFQTQFAGVMNMAELRPARLVLCLSAENTGGVDGAGVGGMSESRKASFMDRLLGRGQGKQRRSLVLAS